MAISETRLRELAAQMAALMQDPEYKKPARPQLRLVKPAAPPLPADVPVAKLVRRPLALETRIRLARAEYRRRQADAICGTGT